MLLNPSSYLKEDQTEHVIWQFKHKEWKLLKSLKDQIQKFSFFQSNILIKQCQQFSKTIKLLREKKSIRSLVAVAEIRQTKISSLSFFYKLIKCFNKMKLKFCYQTFCIRKKVLQSKPNKHYNISLAKIYKVHVWDRELKIQNKTK